MIFHGAAYPTSVPGVELMGLGATTSWVRQPKPRDKIECRKADGKTECRVAGTSGVKALQTALAAMAATTGDSKYDPGEIDGLIGNRTRIATGWAITQIGNTLSSYAKYALIPAAVVLMAGRKETDDLLVQYSSELATAISIGAARVAPQGPIVDPASAASGGGGSSGPAWYTTTNGKIVLAAGAGVVLLLLLKR